MTFTVWVGNWKSVYQIDVTAPEKNSGDRRDDGQLGWRTELVSWMRDLSSTPLLQEYHKRQCLILSCETWCNMWFLSFNFAGELPGILTAPYNETKVVVNTDRRRGNAINILVGGHFKSNSHWHGDYFQEPKPGSDLFAETYILHQPVRVGV